MSVFGTYIICGGECLICSKVLLHEDLTTGGHHEVFLRRSISGHVKGHCVVRWLDNTQWNEECK